MTSDAGRAGPSLPLGPVALLASSFVLLGALTDLPFLLGPIVGLGAAVAAPALRRARSPLLRRTALGVPLAALLLLAPVAPPLPSAELVGGFAALTFLLWVASESARGTDGLRPAMPTLAVIALVFAVALTVAVAFPSVAYGLGIAGALAAVAVLLVGLALAWAGAEPSPPTATD
jgi:hypothetical protein